MARVEIILATLEHAADLAPRMREADRLEAMAAHGRSPLMCTRFSVMLSWEAWTGIVGNDVVCMFGVAPLAMAGGVGCPWLLGSDAVERHGMAFARRNKPMVKGWLNTFPILRNHVDARHLVAIRWLHWIGFDIRIPAEPFGPKGLPFHAFEMRAPR